MTSRKFGFAKWSILHVPRKRNTSFEKSHICPVDKCGIFRGAANRGRTGTVLLPKDFKSFVSAYSTIAALHPSYHIFTPASTVKFLQRLGLESQTKNGSISTSAMTLLHTDGAACFQAPALASAYGGMRIDIDRIKNTAAILAVFGGDRRCAAAYGIPQNICALAYKNCWIHGKTYLFL